MLLYLDNVQSMGAESIAGINRDKGLNENLAREALELHTLGVRSGYSQADVTNFAKVITGWTLRPMALDPDHGNEFVFNPRLHEPGPQTIFGKTYPEFWLNHRPAMAKADDGLHICLRARSREAVDAFYAAALKAGATDDGAPGPRPQYSPGYYAVFFEDPSGNKLEVCCRQSLTA